MCKLQISLLSALYIALVANISTVNSSQNKVPITAALDFHQSLIEEARGQLEDLRKFIQVTIKNASDQIDSLQGGFSRFSIQVEHDGEKFLDERFSKCSDEVKAVRDLGNLAGKNVSFCTDARLEEISGWRDDYKEESSACIRYQLGRMVVVISDGHYMIDTIINKVDSIDFELSRCNDDQTCVGGVIDEVNQNKERLPLDIKIEIDKTKDSLEILKPAVWNCSGDLIDHFAEDGRLLVLEVKKCTEQFFGEK